MRYSALMTSIASRELRNNTRGVLDRVDAGEEITITIDGRAVAVLLPASRRPSSMTREQFVREVVPYQADPALSRELHDLSADTTDDLDQLVARNGLYARLAALQFGEAA